MAKEPKQASAPEIEFDDLTNKLVPDPATIPDDSVALAGFVGRSAEEGNIRLYVDASFRNYYEISISDVLIVGNCRQHNLHREDRSFTLRAALLCGGCRFQRKSKPGFYRARCRMPARGPPARLLSWRE